MVRVLCCAIIKVIGVTTRARVVSLGMDGYTIGLVQTVKLIDSLYIHSLPIVKMVNIHFQSRWKFLK